MSRTADTPEPAVAGPPRFRRYVARSGAYSLRMIGWADEGEEWHAPGALASDGIRSILPEDDQAMAIPRRVREPVPVDHAVGQRHPKFMSRGELASHGAVIPFRVLVRSRRIVRSRRYRGRSVSTPGFTFRTGCSSGWTSG
jgi:hypothetical protein